MKVGWPDIATRCRATVRLQTARGGKPTQNALSESFDGRLRPSRQIWQRQIACRATDELSNETLFGDPRHARGAVRAWREDDNTCRPLPASGDVPPAELAAQIVFGETAAPRADINTRTLRTTGGRSGLGAMACGARLADARRLDVVPPPDDAGPCRWPAGATAVRCACAFALRASRLPEKRGEYARRFVPPLRL